MTIARTFRDLSDKEIADIESANSLVRLGWTGGFRWDEMLKSPRILIVFEAGVGKTHECRAQRDLLWSAGAPAFFLELATLARGNVREMLDPDEEARLDVWLRSQSETATFFLDSIDELELTMGSLLNVEVSPASCRSRTNRADAARVALRFFDKQPEQHARLLERVPPL